MSTSGARSLPARPVGSRTTALTRSALLPTSVRRLSGLGILGAMGLTAAFPAGTAPADKTPAEQVRDAIKEGAL